MTNSKLWNQSEETLRAYVQTYNKSRVLSQEDQALIIDLATDNMRDIIECVGLIQSDEALRNQLQNYNLCQQILGFNSNFTFLTQVALRTQLINSLMKTDKYSCCFKEIQTTYLLIAKFVVHTDVSAEVTLNQLLCFFPLPNSLSEQETYLVAQFGIAVFKFAQYSLLHNEMGQSITQKDYAQALERKSHLDCYLRFLSTREQSVVAELTQLLIQLSFSTKTGYKLVFLIISLRYGSYISQINEDLLAKIVCDCSKMMKRNACVVYKIAAVSFFDLIEIAANTPIDTSVLHPIILKFKETALKVNDTNIHWDSYLKVPENIIQNMGKLELNESSITSHLEMKNYNILNNPEFLALLFTKLRNKEFEIYEQQQYVVLLLSFFDGYYKTLSSAIGSKITSGFFDFILLRLKDLTLNASTFQFISQCLSLMFSCCTRFPIEHQKKLTNLSSIYFNFGTKVIAANLDQANKWFKLCGQIEYVLFKILDDHSKIIKKLNQISFTLMNADAETSALPFLVRAMELWYSSYQGTFMELERNIEEKMNTTMKLLAKATIEECSFNLIINNFKFSELSTAILINMCNLLCSSNKGNKENVISKVIIAAKQSFTDNGLFLYFLSRVTLIIDFQINFKCEDFEFNSDCVASSFKSLIISHIKSVTLTLNDAASVLVLNLLEDIYMLMIKWCQARNVKMSDYEQEVLHTIIITLSYHKMNNWAIEILEAYLKRRDLVTKEQHWKIQSLLARLYIVTNNLKNFKELYKDKVINMIQDPIFKIEIMLCVLEADIKSGNSNVKENMQIIFQLLESDPNYNLSKQNDKYKIISLLFILAKFSHLTSSYHNIYTFDHIESICNLKREIKILQSILKNFLIDSSRAPLLTMNFRCILKLLFSEEIVACYFSLTKILFNIGVCKEFEYYCNELELFTEKQPSNLLQTRYLLEFINQKISLNNKDDAQIYFDKFMKAYENTHLEGDNFYKLKILSTKERFYAFIEDDVNARTSAYELDLYFDHLLSEKNVDSKFLLKSWTKIISRRLIFSCSRYNCSVWVKHFENSTNSYRVALSLYIKCYSTIMKHPKLVDIRRSSISYPLSKLNHNNKPTMDLTLIIDSLKKCESTYSKTLTSHFQNLPIDILKADIEKLTNCFVNLVRYDTSMSSIEANNVNWILSVSDNFKYLPFIYEKDLALIELVNNESLPKLASLTKVTAPFFNTQRCILPKLLPKKWSCITIDYNHETDCVVLNKYQANYEEPIMFQLSLKRLSDRLSFSNSYSALHDIIRKSDYSTKPEVTSNILTREQKIEWWAKRNELDLKLAELLTNIESNWFGGFNSLFNENKFQNETIQQLQKNVISIIYESLKEQFVDTVIVNRIINILKSFDLRIFELLLNINQPTAEKVKDILVFLFDRTIIDTSDQVEKSLFKTDSISLKVLNLIKKTRKLYHNATENNLASDHHIFIVPGPECVSVPWESIPSLREKSTSRFPSVKHLVDSLQNNKDLLESGISTDKGYYVINPGGDLQRTEKNLGHQFEELYGWNGIIGYAPEESDIINGFKNSNLYVYAGHGGGEQYIRSATLKKQEKIPPALLFGCSSGQLKTKGSLSPYGTPYNYLMGNCPSLLVNLWDVTDKDTDLFTISVLKSWGLLVDYSDLSNIFTDSESKTLSHCITEGRNTCKLKYLNGAAPVLYGLPLKLGGN